MTCAAPSRRPPGTDTIELPGGLVTPGRWDTRSCVDKLPFPASLEGKRCLDVGTWDGFWAFEMERRGAAEVMAIDVSNASGWDWPPSAGTPTVDAWQGGGAGARTGFDIAHEALGSRRQPARAVGVRRLAGRDRHLRPRLHGLTPPAPARPGTSSCGAESGRRGEAHLGGRLFDDAKPRSAAARPAADLAGLDVPHWGGARNLAARRRLLEAAWRWVRPRAADRQARIS